MYTAIDGERLDHVMSKGTYRDDKRIFANTMIYAHDHVEMEFFKDPKVSNKFMEDLTEYKNPATIVWNGKLFIPEAGHEYFFKDPDDKLAAIDGIAEFKMR